MDEKEKWALAYDKGGKHCGYMTSNMAEIFNSILRGVQSLHVTIITYFTFYKCNESFVKCLVDAQMVHRHVGVTRIKLRRRWTDDDYVDGGSPDDEDTIYDTHTQEGSHVELGPILDCVVCFLLTLFRFSNDVSFY
jgi:hypothetical protein